MQRKVIHITMLLQFTKKINTIYNDSTKCSSLLEITLLGKNNKHKMNA